MISIQHLSLKLGEFSLRDVNLTVAPGEFFALLGPTGSGKTVLLESIAGLKELTQGSILLNGRDITAMRPEERRISICYQDCALFPHMKVKDNINYGVRFSKDQSNPKYKRNFAALVELLRIGDLLQRYPTHLSGGEKQRVALARALVVDPVVLLLDEPLSALDTNIKETIQRELKSLHQELQVTTMMVTHSFAEAYALANRVGIIHQGRILQTGTLQEVFERPQSVFVAKFVGVRNLFSLGDGTGRTGGVARSLLRGRDGVGTAQYVGIRPENIIISNESLATDHCFQGVIEAIRNTGTYLEIDVNVEDALFQCCLTPNHCFEINVEEGQVVFLGFSDRHVNVIRN